MPGDPSARSPDHQGPYMIISKDGQKIRIPLAGNPSLPSSGGPAI
jgi:hypothetical protein